MLNTLWRHKWVVLPVALLTLLACGYMFLFAPRTYEATVTYALTAPDVPSTFQLEHDAELAKLNANNPYLRSADSSLLTQVVIAKLSDPAYVEELKGSGFATEFKITPVASLGMGLVSISANADSESQSESTAGLIAERFSATLRDVQKVNGADDRYLYTPILVRGPGPAQELFSSRLRSVIMVGIAGAVLLFGAVSVAQSLSIRRQRRRMEQASHAILTSADLETSAFLMPAEGRRRAR
jgi:capsular polysaccharide biosynthesis protein